MQIKHPFKDKAHGDLKELFQDVSKFDTFLRRVEAASKKNATRYDSNKYKGDAFEMFVEMFLNAFKFDNRFGLTNYTPVLVEDNGVDGVGYNSQGQKSVVQVKYRGDSNYILEGNQDHLQHLMSDGMATHDVVLAKIDKDEQYKHYIFSTAKDLNYYTKESVFKNAVYHFGRKDFKYMLDNNKPFWDYCRELVA